MQISSSYNQVPLQFTHDCDVEGTDETHSDDGGPGGKTGDSGEGESRGVQADTHIDEILQQLARRGHFPELGRLETPLDVL